MYTPTPRLILHPEDHHYLPDKIATILHHLHKINFIAEPATDANTFPVGSEFINLLTFMGCSPNINLSPEDGDNYCSIFIPDAHDHCTLLGYTSTAIPRCPECKHKISDWKQHFHDLKHGDTVYHCPECNHQTTVEQLNWRQEAGFGRFAIEVRHIHPHEAVPSDKLLNTLQEASNTGWTYFYATN